MAPARKLAPAQPPATVHRLPERDDTPSPMPDPTANAAIANIGRADGKREHPAGGTSRPRRGMRLIRGERTPPAPAPAHDGPDAA